MVSDVDGEMLESLRRAEKEQALLYRRLGALAETVGDEELAQRFHDLHADEQHHLSRLTARLLELGGRPVDLGDIRVGAATLDGWETLVHQRETLEVQRYREAIERPSDEATRSLLLDILGVEERHLTGRGGKWTLA